MDDLELKRLLTKAKSDLEILIGAHSGNLKSQFLQEPYQRVKEVIRELELRESEKLMKGASCN